MYRSAGAAREWLPASASELRRCLQRTAVDDDGLAGAEAADAEAPGHRLQEDRKGKHIHRAGANQETADRREDDPPTIPKEFRHRGIDQLPMRTTSHTFDLKALHAALDAERCARGLSWSRLTAEINKPFAGTSSKPISETTIREMPTKGSVTSAVVLQVLRWLRRTPESFLSGRTIAPEEDEALPDHPGASRILRFDTRAMYAALNKERAKRSMTWRQVADGLPGFTASMLTNLANGPLIGFPRVMTITQWLDRPAASFVRARDR